MSPLFSRVSGLSRLYDKRTKVCSKIKLKNNLQKVLRAQCFQGFQELVGYMITSKNYVQTVC